MSSLQCAEGYICVTFDTGSRFENSCAKPCAVEQDVCDDGSACYCPDSPAKARCFDERGDRIGICGGGEQHALWGEVEPLAHVLARAPVRLYRQRD